MYCERLILALRLKHPTDEGVIPETSRTNKTEHFFYEHFHITLANRREQTNSCTLQKKSNLLLNFTIDIILQPKIGSREVEKCVIKQSFGTIIQHF